MGIDYSATLAIGFKVSDEILGEDPHDEVERLCGMLTDELGFEVEHSTEGNYWTGAPSYFVIGPATTYEELPVEDGRFTAGGALSFTKVTALAPKLDALKVALERALGRDVGEATVCVAVLVS